MQEFHLGANMKKIVLTIMAFAGLSVAVSVFGADSYIQLPPDSTGKKTRAMDQSISGSTVYQQNVLIGDPTTPDVVTVNSDGSLNIRLKSAATTIDTSTTPLANGASYTTPVFDSSVNGHGFTVAAKADQNGHVYHEQSIDGSAWFPADDYIYTANSGHNEEHIGHPRYNRFKFTNDSGVGQTNFIFSVIQRHMDGFGTVKIAASQNEVTQGNDVPWQMQGAKTNNSAAPGTTNIGTLPAVATTSAPTYTSGNQAALSTNTGGGLRVTLDGETVPVTGTFWQATQPVSGTFWQATQPVSIAASVTVAQSTAASLKAEVVGASADNSAAASNNVSTLPAIVETSTTPPTRTDGNRAALAADADGKVFVRAYDWDPLFVTSGLSTATTLTQLVAAPGAGVSIYITGWKCSASVAATATADQQCTLKYGTGTNCGTGTTYVDGCFQIANGGCAESMSMPLKVPANNALCWVHAATGSKITRVNYFLAP